MSPLAAQEIRLPVIDEDGRRNGVEALPAHSLGMGKWCLLHSPGMVEGVAAGDIIQIDPDVLRGFHIVQRGGNLAIWLFVPQQAGEYMERDALLGLVERPIGAPLRRLGGYCDGGLKGLLVYTIPVRAGFSDIETIFDAAVRQLPGASWMYTNVYDLEDGRTPLNWWVEH